tara:strand:+ start:166 stop:495 length:330 start_codon:yes stop_codon:yes gene_type:complete
MYRLTLIAQRLGMPYNEHAGMMNFYFKKDIFQNLYLPSTNVRERTGNTNNSVMTAQNLGNIKVNVTAIQNELNQLEKNMNKYQANQDKEAAKALRAYRSALLAIKKGKR